MFNTKTGRLVATPPRNTRRAFTTVNPPIVNYAMIWTRIFVRDTEPCSAGRKQEAVNRFRLISLFGAGSIISIRRQSRLNAFRSATAHSPADETLNCSPGME